MVCGHSDLRGVENVKHFVLRCDGLVREREVLMMRMAEVTVLDEGCRDLKAGKAIEYMWRKRFCSPE